MRIEVYTATAGGGPAIFTHRLCDQIGQMGHQVFGTRDGREPEVRLNVISGPTRSCAINVQRLDGLYFDSEDPETDEKNDPIFSAYESHDHIIFQTEFSRKMYEAHTKRVRPNTVIHNGAPRLFRPGPRHKHLRIRDKMCIASASWRRHKRLEEIVEAFDHFEDVGLIVLNGTEYWDFYNKVPANVLMLPRVSPDNLPMYYNSADAMIHISWLDWCPNTVIEAQCCGLPILCSHNGGTREIISHGVVANLESTYHPSSGKRVSLYNPPTCDMDSLVKGIETVLTMTRREDIPDKLYIDNTAQRYLDVFQGLLDSRAVKS